MSVLLTAGRGPSPGVRSRRGGRPRSATTRSQSRAAAVFLSPAMLLIGLFIVVPMLLTLWISFHRWSMFTSFGDMKWAGLSNYTAVATDSSHLGALRNTVVYAGLSLAVTLPMALLIAMLLYFPTLRGRAFVRVALFSTYVIPTVAIVIIWGNLYAPDYGPLARMLEAVGITSPAWLSDPSWALVSLVIFNVWQMLGYYVVLLVAGLTQISDDIYEAARIDGAGILRQTSSITIPLLKRSLVFVGMMTLINSVQVFDPVYLLTQGGPADSTNVLSFDIQRTAFQYGLAGEASAMAFTLLLLLVLAAGVVGAIARVRS